ERPAAISLAGVTSGTLTRAMQRYARASLPLWHNAAPAQGFTCAGILDRLAAVRQVKRQCRTWRGSEHDQQAKPAAARAGAGAVRWPYARLATPARPFARSGSRLASPLGRTRR